MEADTGQFVSEMNKADKTIKTTAQNVKDSAGAVKGLTSAFDTLTGGAIPGLGELGKQLGAARQMSMALKTSWDVLKRSDFAVSAIAGMRGYTVSTVAADGATKALTVSTIAFTSAATLGIGAAVYAVTSLISSVQKQREETERLRQEEARLYQDRLQKKQQDIQKQQDDITRSFLNIFESSKTAEQRQNETSKLLNDKLKERLEIQEKFVEFQKIIETNEKNLKNYQGRAASSPNATPLKWYEDLAKAKREQGKIQFIIDTVPIEDTIKLKEALDKKSRDDERDLIKTREESSKQILDQMKSQDQLSIEKLQAQFHQLESLAALGGTTQDQVNQFGEYMDRTIKGMGDNLLKPYIESIMTNEEKIARDLDKFSKAVIDAAELGVKITDAQKELIMKSIEERYGSTQSGMNLQAMTMGSLQAFQSIKQTQDPNTKLLGEIAESVNNLRREAREGTAATNRTNEILQSPN